MNGLGGLACRTSSIPSYRFRDVSPLTEPAAFWLLVQVKDLTPPY